jgi:hypothetical protein
MNMRFEPNDVAGGPEAYLLYERRSFGRLGPLIGVYRNATKTIENIGLHWPKRDQQRLFAAYSNGRLREIVQSVELLRQIETPQSSGAF